MTPNPADELAKLSNEELSDQLTHFGNQGDSWVDWSRLIAEAARRLRASPPVAPASSAAGTREIISEGSCPECGKSSQDYGRFRKSDKFEAGDADGEIYECGYCGSTQQPVADDTPPALPSSGLGEAVTKNDDLFTDEQMAELKELVENVRSQKWTSSFKQGCQRLAALMFLSPKPANPVPTGATHKKPSTPPYSPFPPP